MDNFTLDKEAKYLMDTTTHYGLARDYVLLLGKFKELEQFLKEDVI